MTLILILLIVLLLFGGGGHFYGRRAGWNGRQYGGGLIGLLVLLFVVFLVIRALEPPVPMPGPTPQITTQ